MGKNMRKYICSVILCCFALLYVDNNFFYVTRADAAETLENNRVSIKIVKDFDSTDSDNVLLDDYFYKDEGYNLPRDISDDFIILNYVDKNGNSIETGSRVNIDNLQESITYKAVCIPAVNITIANPVTGEVYAQKAVKGYSLLSEEKLDGYGDLNTPKKINESILKTKTKKSDNSFDGEIENLKDANNVNIKNKLQLDNNMFLASYNNLNGDPVVQKIQTINSITLNSHCDFILNFYANVTIKDEDNNDVTGKPVYKVQYYDNLKNIILNNPSGYEFKRWITQSIQIKHNHDNTWSFNQIIENTNFIVEFDKKIYYSFEDSLGNSILENLSGCIGKGGNIILPKADNDKVKNIVPEGKVLVGWEDKEGNLYSGIIENVEKDIILIPKFVDKVKLTYEMGESISSIDVGANQSIKITDPILIPNTLFKCYRDEKGNEYTQGDIIVINSDIRLKAIYRVKAVYVDENGNKIGERWFEMGDKMTYIDPVESSHISHEFSFWYPSLKNIYENTTVKAMYNIKRFNVRINGNNQEVDYGKDAVMPKNAPYKEGYDFIGWSKDGKNVTEDTVIDPIFTEKEYTVSFDGVGQKVKYGEDAIAPVAPVKEGYYFIGWSDDFTNVKSNLSITSDYLIKEFNIIVNGVNQNVKYDQNVILPSENPTKEGYIFKGWIGEISNIKSDGVVDPIFEKVKQPNAPEKPNEEENQKPVNPDEPGKEESQEPANPEKPGEGDTQKPISPENPSQGDEQEPSDGDNSVTSGDYNSFFIIMSLLSLSGAILVKRIKKVY